MAPHKILYSVSYRNIKYPRLEFKTGKLLFILPHGYKPDYLLDKHKKWIAQKSEFIKRCLKASSGKKLVKRTDKQFKKLVYSFIDRASREMGVELHNVLYKKMKTKWASCSPKRNLTMNMLMKHLPDKLIEYVIFHEMVHMLEKRHNDNFWKIITRKFKNYQKLEKDLFIYWFQVAKKL
ncbi:MAG: M48 family metallopeptidase [Thermodesulfovibrionales bacterium]|nr:M48 family metallopeptidase [Thermodesulfovibrionales bacterium]